MVCTPTSELSKEMQLTQFDTVPPVSSVSVYGYRGFAKETTIRLATPKGEDGSGLTILTGPNSGGKSSVLEAISMLGAPNPVELGRAKRSRNRKPRTRYTFVDDSELRLEAIAAGTSATEWSSPNQSLHGRILMVNAGRGVAATFNEGATSAHDYARQTAIPSRDDRYRPPPIAGRLQGIAQDRAA